MAEQVVRADKRLRRLAVAACLAGALGGALAIQWVLPWGQRYLARQETRAALGIVQMAMGLVFLSVAPLAIYLYWLGRRIVQSRRMPPPGMKVIRNIRIIEGDRAVARGRMVIVLAAFLFVLSLVGGLYFPYRLGQVFGARPQGNPAAQVEPAPRAPAP